MFLKRGSAYGKKGELDRAVADYDSAISINPKYAVAFTNRGNTYAQKGDLDRAVADYDRAISINPKDAGAIVNRGITYAEKGDLNRSILDFDRAIAINPGLVEAFYNRGVAYLKTGDLDRSIADHDRAIAINPDYALAFNNRGDAYQSKGDLTRAVADFDRFIALAPPGVDAVRAKRDAATKIALARAAEALKPSAVAEAPLPSPAPVTAKPTPAPGPQARRLALVVGNGGYAKIGSLRNTVADARAIGEKLVAKGFDVTSRFDLGRTDFLIAFDRFKEQVGEGDEVVIYYAGHGLELEGANFLIPTDVPAFSPGAKQLIQDSSVNLVSLLIQLSGRSPRATVVILDACRNNPFPNDLKVASNTRSGGVVKEGLGQVSAPEGTMVMYSAGVNQTALDRLGDDDRDPNGLFTRRLLRLMDEEGLEISGMAKRLRGEVQAAAKTVNDEATGKPHAQTPAVYDQMVGEFYFTARKG
ncbi:tetratricopeptide repeat protein [Methylopila sp. M107]|uniref:tetratricopeptide repeat protein n=1 Tax=Methylopila sp. M107 TaxID=1101190 RepID=UPI001FDA3114|nr:tetratricopeptide repeat protein [Methylopila sp. M107]